MSLIRLWLSGPLLGVMWCGCMSFATVRSAEVHPGLAMTAHGSYTAPPGSGLSWFHDVFGDCAFDCDMSSLGGIDLSLAWSPLRSMPFTVGGGTNGLYPYVESYFQLSRSPRLPFGLGVRLGIPIDDNNPWVSHQVSGRLDVVLRDGTRLLINPVVNYHTQNFPAGRDHPNHYYAFVPSFGVEFRGDRVSVTPALAVGLATGYAWEDFNTVFGALSVSITFHRSRSSSQDR